ncbi:hypothetical protein JOE11_002344 [Robbsia andropogonis]
MKHEDLPPEVAALVAEQERINALPIIASYALWQPLDRERNRAVSWRRRAPASVAMPIFA